MPIRCWIQKDTPYVALTGELCGVFCEHLWGNHTGTALYIFHSRSLAAYFIMYLAGGWKPPLKVIKLRLGLYLTIVVLNLFKETSKYIRFAFSIIAQAHTGNGDEEGPHQSSQCEAGMAQEVEFFITEGKDQFSLYCRWHDCLFPGDARSQGIRSDMVFIYSSRNIPVSLLEWLWLDVLFCFQVYFMCNCILYHNSLLQWHKHYLSIFIIDTNESGQMWKFFVFCTVALCSPTNF